MELPNRHLAYVPEEKITRYLLDWTTPKLDFTHFRRHERENLRVDDTERPGVPEHQCRLRTVKNLSRPATGGAAPERGRPSLFLNLVKGKAGAFRGRGYDDNNVEVFIQDLIALAHTASVINVIPSPHGMKYVVDGEIYTPDGRPMNVHTIWMIDTGQDAPRLISAYPDDSEVAT